jgi:archaeosine-15-forming tRNA-guanine transglycosylase
MQLIFLISELNGKFECGFEEAELAIEQGEYEEYIKEGKHIFERYILYKEEDLDDIIV